MCKRPRGGLYFRVHAMADRAALHKNDRVMPVFARDCGRQSGHEFRLGPSNDEFKTVRRNVMAFIYNDLTIVCHPVIYHVSPNETLNQSHIQSACQLLSSAPKPANATRWNSEERNQPFNPLFQELLTMDQYNRIDASLRDEPSGNHGFAEGRCCCQHACLMPDKRVGGQLADPAAMCRKRKLPGVGRQNVHL